MNVFLLPIFVLLLAGSAKSKPCCKNPKGQCDDVKIEHGQTYVCTKTGWIPDCPTIIEVEDVLYRFFDTREFTSCKGNINQCVYLSHWREFCMNGNYPIVSPVQLQPEFNQNLEEFSEETQDQQLVYTYMNRTGAGPTSFDMNTASQPVRHYTIYSKDYYYRTVCGGFSWTDVNGNVKQYGDTNGPYGLVVPVATVDIPTRGYIVEVNGRAGDVIDRLTLSVLNSITGDVRPYTCGGIYGTLVDATPPPDKYGRCFMVSIAGSYSDYLKTLVFTWTCLGN